MEQEGEPGVTETGITKSAKKFVNPLSQRHRCGFNGEYRTAIVSLFSIYNFGARAIYSFLKECEFDTDLVFLKDSVLDRNQLEKLRR